MRDLKLIGTEEYPLHCSALAQLLRCPWRVAMVYLFSPSDESGAAANTGSATHAAIAAWHKGKDEAAAIEEMCARTNEYPLASLSDAADMFLSYSKDPRNNTAKVVLTEESVSFCIAPAPEDPTQAPIQVIGRLDQVREVDGVLKLYDIKTSVRDGIDLLNDHMIQIAAYCVGASYKLGQKVSPGALICPRQYRKRQAVFWHFPWKYEDIEYILRPVRYAVARLRAGDTHFVSGDGCKWCPAKSPDLCIPAYKKTFAQSLT